MTGNGGLVFAPSHGTKQKRNVLAIQWPQHLPFVRRNEPVAMPQEVELKLDLSADAAHDLIASDILGAEAQLHRLRTPYFDTPDRVLLENGFTLRIRDAGNSRIQTVKAAGSAAAGLFARPEWERPVESDQPLLDDTNPLRSLLGERIRDMAPVFEVQVERRIWNVQWEGALIEVVLDRGQVVAGERTAPICEIELELKQGRPAALFSLARRLGENAPLRLGVVNKAERGFRLLGPVEYAFKSGPVELEESHEAAEAFRRIAGACVRQFRLNEPFVEQRIPEALHQARVALRRLRSAFSIFAPMLSGEAFARLREETKWLANTLGDARDLDVMLADGLGGEAARPQLERAREEAYDSAAAALDSARARALMLDLSEWLAHGDWLTAQESAGVRGESVREYASSALDRFRRKVKKHGRNLETLSDEERHTVRKDAKKLRYAAEFFAILYKDKRNRRRARKFLAALEALQDRLGALNDLAMAENRSSAILPEPDVRTDVRRKEKLLDAAADAHDDFADAKPFWR